MGAFEHLPEVAVARTIVECAVDADRRPFLADGGVDIVVGTHAILAKGVEFKRLGLVIVDEEQRFGVTHKERLKALRHDVHVLTLTATPIPRTLQMALSGIRELSVIATPPVDRLAVRTTVSPWDPVVVREALLREHYRGGQSFLVVPRISDLPDIEADQRGVKQVMLNLISNAVKFTEQGHVSLDVEVVAEDADNVELCFAVSDSGIGIKSEILGQIFDSFVQADSGIQRKYGGSGLGLSIAREIANGEGGTLTLTNRAGGGLDAVIALLRQA